MRYTVDGVQLDEDDPIYLVLPKEPTTGLWCSPFAVKDKEKFMDTDLLQDIANLLMRLLPDPKASETLQRVQALLEETHGA